MVTTAIVLLLGTLPAPKVTFERLLRELSYIDSLTSLPEPAYECLQASSYNRESTKRDQPGWFADSDGVGFIRKQANGEFVMMEHSGPGCITKFWTPFFYYGFNDLTGPNVRIYLDGNPKPVIDEPLILLVQGKGSIKEPWGKYSARAGNLYLPIPFAKSAKVTMVKNPFYFLIDYRSYVSGTAVETWQPSFLHRDVRALDTAAKNLTVQKDAALIENTITLTPGGTTEIALPGGSRAVDQLQIQLKEALSSPEVLRSTVISATFDGEETVWTPVGDFFCSADSVHEFSTFARSVASDGKMTCRWKMPYQKSAVFRVHNFGQRTIRFHINIGVQPWNWNARSMHFFARWRPDDIVPGTPFQDWNFIDVRGKGVYVGDAWTVLNVRPNSWWGEGDEKIYVDSAWEKGFPTHFGTGTEDYYGWAGGEYPVLKDQFSAPFLANVKVGGLDGHTRGFNICTRTRGLDAIPFQNRLIFDMESSFGTDMREKWDLLGYSSVVFFYARPGAQHNRPAMPDSARKPLMSIQQIEQQAAKIRAGGG